MDVSVVTTLYNYRRFIPDAINSFLQQDFFKNHDAEMIIVDDASTDAPIEAIEPLTKSGKIIYTRLDKNGGYSKAKNIGISMSKAEVLVMLDADDMLTPDSISKRYNKLMEGYDFVHGPAIDLEDGKQSASKLWKNWLKSNKDASAYKCVHAQTVMLRKEIHRKVGLYDETLRFKSDREMWARAFNHGIKIGWVDTPVCIYRKHGKQMHKSKEKLAINDKLEAEVQRKIAMRAKNLSDVRMLK